MPSTARCPHHRLELYRQSVQHVQAEADFLIRCYQQARRRSESPTLLREDFCGTAALAAHWVSLSENHRALAIDCHAPTLRWAQKQARRALGDRLEDCLLLHGDVMALCPPQTPKVDLVVALNFSSFIYHDPSSLIAYFRQARRSLRPGGLLVIDAFGGPGAMTPGIQSRWLTLTDRASDAQSPQIVYQWHQKSFDPVTHRIDCAIHFEGSSPDGSSWRLENAFVYRWRLWTLPELTWAMKQAGFDQPEVWLPPPLNQDRYATPYHPTLPLNPALGSTHSSSPPVPPTPSKPATGKKTSGRSFAGGRSSDWSDGRYRPVRSSDAQYDWVAYVVGRR